MPSTYTLNNGIELIGTGEQSGTWGDTTNTNLELLDTALDGQVTVTLASAGTSGSPNTLPISDGAASDGRNRMVIFDDSSDLGATAYVQLTPNDAEKIIYVRNSLSGDRSILLFQGTYSASNDYELPAGNTAIIYFDGAGAGAVAANVMSDAHFDSLNIVGNADVGGTLSVTGAVDFSSSLAVDTITEKTAAAGVTIDSVLLKDDVVNATDIETSNISANDGTAAGTIADSTGLVTITSFKSDSVDIGGGAIDDTPIGATTRAAGYFTSLEANGNATLGSDTSDTLAINSEIHSNVLFDDNTYNIGASGASRPANIYVGSTYHGQQASLGSNTSSNTGPPSNGVVIAAPGASSGYYSAALEFDINGGGGNARMYTQRLGGAGGIFYLDTDNTSAVYYKRLVINQDGEQYWYNNNATDGSIAMQLVSKALTVNGTISSNHTDGLISLNGASGAVYANIRAYAGNDGYLMFTENTVADRWSIGVEGSDNNLYFRNGNYTSATKIAKLGGAGNLTLGDTAAYTNSMLTIRSRTVASSLGNTLVISNIDAQGQNANYGAVGDIALRSSTGFANNGANAHLSIRRLAWASAAGSTSDLTEGVGLWLGGYYDNSGTGLPVYLGGYQFSSDNPDVQIKGGKLSIGVSPQDWAWPDGTTRTLDFQSDNAITSYNGTLYMSSNWYYNQGAGGEKYSDNGTAGRHYQAGGDFYIDSAPNNTSGAGAGLTWTNRFKLETAGVVKIDSTAGTGTGNKLIVGFGNTTPNTVSVFNTGDQNYSGITVSNWDGATTTQGPRIHFDNSGHGEWYIGSTNNNDFFDITDAWGTNTYLRVDNVGRLLVDRSTHNSRLGAATKAQIGSMGIISLGIGSTATDTGIDINQLDAGNSALFIVSRNTGAGVGTASGMYFIKFFYNGNNAPTVSHIAQDNFISFGVSGSNTLTVANPGGGNCGGLFISCR